MSSQLSEEEEKLHLGHPSARGCRGCHELGLECSLIEESMSYPCDNCLEDDCDCILITPPKNKDACEECKCKKLPCSYRENRGVGLRSCESCEDAGHLCITGPEASRRMDEFLRKLAPRTTFVPNLDSQCVTCSFCSANKISCSIRTKDDEPSCKICDDNNMICTFETIPRPARQQKTPSKKSKLETNVKIKSNNSSRPKADTSATYNHQQQPVYSEKSQRKICAQKVRKTGVQTPPVPVVKDGKVVQMRTSFCHPIKFNYIPPPLILSEPGYKPCHFCVVPGGELYGALGLGEKDVQLIVWDSGFGNEEIAGGWSEEGAETTRMCEDCTFRRLKIVLCEGHEIRPIDGVDERDFDWKAAYEDLFAGNFYKDDGLGDFGSGFGKPVSENGEGKKTMIPDRQKPMASWCSICIAPAFYECCARHSIGEIGGVTSEGHDEGCGLQLCEVCAIGACNGSLPPSQPSEDLSSAGSKRQGNGGGLKALVKLDDLIEIASWDKFNYPDGVRADVTLLTSKGELMRRANVGFGEIVDGDESEGDDQGDMWPNMAQNVLLNGGSEGMGDSGQQSIGVDLEVDEGVFVVQAGKKIEVIELSD